MMMMIMMHHHYSTSNTLLSTYTSNLTKLITDSSMTIKLFPLGEQTLHAAINFGLKVKGQGQIVMEI